MDELEKAQQEITRLKQENEDLKNRLGKQANESNVAVLEKPPVNGHQLDSFDPVSTIESLPRLNSKSSPEEKIKVFRSLFRGREDVYPAFWENERKGTKGYSPARKDPWNWNKNKPKEYLPLTDDVVRDHLSGQTIIGVYPLLRDNTCWFLACDFDEGSWALDATGFVNICGDHGIPAYLERSRSGNGGHVWIFFSSPVAATSARKLGMSILRETMELRAEIDLDSYDRFFPNQDFMPKGGFGNLIALPLQKQARRFGNTEFLDTNVPGLKPWPDQWAFLSQIKRVDPMRLGKLLEKIPPIIVGPGTPPKVSRETKRKYPAPKIISSVFGSQLSIEKSGFPPWFLSQIKHQASLWNPKFFKLQSLRKSTFRTPRFIKCYEEDGSHLHVPRGLQEEIERVAKEAGSQLNIVDQRQTPKNIRIKFHGTLKTDQKKAMAKTLSQDMGILVAPPGAGKTVMGCYAIAKRKLPTLILAHRKPIIDQWKKQISTLLKVDPKQIGQIGGGKSSATGRIDVGMIQSFKRASDLEGVFSQYGFIVVDEVHHLPAATFEAVIRRAPIRYILGLTATLKRRDGLQDIINMQCGPIRHTMISREDGLERNLVVRETSLDIDESDQVPIQEVNRILVNSGSRNDLIVHDVLERLKEGRKCLVLSDWKEHCQILVDAFEKEGEKPIFLSGGQGKKERAALMKSIEEQENDKDLLIIATGSYIGEGFDCPQIDTLFLTFPVSFKGKLTQYVGRAEREHENKTDVLVYEYADIHVPVFKKNALSPNENV